ncbi:ubiquitin carboxyl-terminal hydrolase 21 isoform X3 [Cetorhinus maximus]
MNAVLQCLSNTSALRDYCIRREYQLEGTGYRKKRCELMDAFASLISALWEPSASGSVNPIQFQQKFQKLVPHFAGYSDDEKSMQMWKRYLERDDSKIVDLFVGQLNSTLRCTTCGYKSTTFEVFCDLSLPLPKRLSMGDRVSLSECLSLFTAEEELDTDNAPLCGRCNQRKSSTKKLTIQRFPTFLVLHLNRFSLSHYGIRKSTTYVEFPLYGLSLRQCAANKAGNPIYDLYAVCNHTGTVNGGHYTAYCKSGGKWHVYNDSRVSLMQENQVVSTEAYVLFYQLDETRSIR